MARTEFTRAVRESTKRKNEFLRENVFHRRTLNSSQIPSDRLFTFETLNDEEDLVAERNLTTGEILGLTEVKKRSFNVTNRFGIVVFLDEHRR